MLWWPVCASNNLIEIVRMWLSSVVVVQSQTHVWLCDPMDCSTPASSVLHYLPKFAQTHVCWVSDDIQPPHPLSSPSPPVFLSFFLSFSSQSLPASGSFPMSLLFASGGQSIGASASVLSMNIQDQFPLGLTSLISLQPKGLWRVFSSKTQMHQFFSAQPSLWSNSHICTWLLENQYGYLSAKWCLLLFNMLSRFVIAFLPRSKHLLISWLQSPSTVILEPRKIKTVTPSTFSPSIWHEVMGSDATNFIFWMLSFKPTS